MSFPVVYSAQSSGIYLLSLMADSSPGSGSGTTAPSNERRLESWGEIASYLRRDIRTVQRWERNLGLPIHRLAVGKQSSVFAYPSELDKWFKEQEREKRLEKDELEAAAAARSGPPVSVSNEPVNNHSDQSIPVPLERVRTGRPAWKWIIAGAVLIFAGLLIALIYKDQIPEFSIHPRNSSHADARIRLFVRPLKSAAGDQSQDNLAEGLTAETISQLGRLDPAHLAVIAPTSAEHFRDKAISELVRTFRVEYVLEGYVQRVNSRVHINVLLISAKDETNTWSDSFDGDMADILKVQRDVAEKVGRELLSELPPPSAQPAPVQIDPAGYRAYLQGRKSWAARDMAPSVREYEQAVALMPDYALAHSGLASAYALLGQAPNDGVPATTSAPKAIAEARRSLELNKDNSEAHYVLGNIAMCYTWDFPAAERELKEAIRIEPNNPTAHQWMGQYYMVTNRIADAQVETGKALDLDPVSPIFTIARAEASYYAHDFDATIANANLTLEQTPHFVLAEFWLGSAYREKRMYAESLQHFRNATTLVPNNPALLMAYGYALAVSGDAQGARNVLTQLQSLSQHRFVPAIYFAGIYTGLSDKNSAFHWLDKAVREHNDRLIYLKVDPISDPLRSDPRFTQLMNQVHMP
jgi:TolB-like protein/Flp pilus assembly protein TadD